MASQPDLPIPISAVGDKYLIFDIDAVTWLRRTHNICGVFVGTLPQNPAQNVFLGLPVEIMPEEAQLLVEKGVGYIVDDVQKHESSMRSIDAAHRNDYLSKLRNDAELITITRTREKELERAEKMKQGKLRQKAKSQRRSVSDIPKPDDSSQPIKEDETILESVINEKDHDNDGIDDTSLFDSTSTLKPQFTPSSSTSTITTTTLPPTTSSIADINTSQPEHTITPTTTPSTLLRSPQTQSYSKPIPNLPTSYPLYRHLNSLGYFQTPGLRFGCQYCVYPGDPLRFHSHFLAVGVQWDEDIDLMDIVGGGRLGTGVKKSWLLGGEEQGNEIPDAVESIGRKNKKNMRTFSVEWAGM